MSLKEFTVCGKPDWQNRSYKMCVCGGHNHKNVKKNLHHHGTAMRLLYQQGRIIKERLRLAWL